MKNVSLLPPRLLSLRYGRACRLSTRNSLCSRRVVGSAPVRFTARLAAEPCVPPIAASVGEFLADRRYLYPCLAYLILPVGGVLSHSDGAGGISAFSW